MLFTLEDRFQHLRRDLNPSATPVLEVHFIDDHGHVWHNFFFGIRVGFDLGYDFTDASNHVRFLRFVDCAFQDFNIDIWHLFSSPFVLGICIIAPHLGARTRALFLASKHGAAIHEPASADDARLITDHNFRNGFLLSIAEAYRQGDDSILALYEERLMQMKNWDVDLTQIPPGLTTIWHGTDDMRIPVANAYRNAETIPGTHLKIVDEKGHFFLFDNLECLDDILK